MAGGILLFFYMSLYLMGPFYLDVSNQKHNKRIDPNNQYITIKECIGKNSDSSLSIFLIISSEDLKRLPPILPKHKIIYTNDSVVIKRLLDMPLSMSGDMTTLGSKFIVCQGWNVLFQCNVLIDRNCLGFQSNSTGWMEPLDKRILLESLTKFKKYEFPILLKW